MLPSIRLGALIGLSAVYMNTSGSVTLAVAGDDPIHQPIEKIASLSPVPGMDVLRPADSMEVVATFCRILAAPDRTVALVLSRQDLPVLFSTGPTTAAVTAGCLSPLAAG